MATRSLLLPANIYKAVRPSRHRYSHQLFRPFCRHQCTSVAACNQPPAAPALVLGAAQLVATRDLATNVSRIIESIMAAGREGIDLLAFAEAATTGESVLTKRLAEPRRCPATVSADTGVRLSSALTHLLRSALRV